MAISYLVDPEFHDYTSVLVIVNVADYIAAFGLVAFVVAAGWTAFALADPYGELRRIRTTDGS